jgi:mannose-6-phosphate isomerase
MHALYPMTFEPVLKDYLWGGRNLERLGRPLPPQGIIAESWEIAGHPDGTSRVANGPFAGQLLTQVHAQLGLDLIGRNSAWAQARGRFPLLIKLLDAQRSLSVQVHPDDAYALAHEEGELGKTEMWVVLHAEPEAELILGVRAGTTPAVFRQALQAGHLEPYLHRLPVKAGDHVCVPAGSLHAIMAGTLLVEIQQNSNTTYRVYDWNRLGADGKPRPLHIARALEVIDFDQVEPTLCPAVLIAADGQIRRFSLCQTPYFVTERVEMAAGAVYHGHCTGASLEIWGAIDGRVTINDLPLAAVHFALLPAALGEFAVTANGPATLLRTYVDAPAHEAQAGA